MHYLVMWGKSSATAVSAILWNIDIFGKYFWEFFLDFIHIAHISSLTRFQSIHVLPNKHRIGETYCWTNDENWYSLPVWPQNGSPPILTSMITGLTVYIDGFVTPETNLINQLTRYFCISVSAMAYNRRVWKREAEDAEEDITGSSTPIPTINPSEDLQQSFKLHHHHRRSTAPAGKSLHQQK